jgi:predicted DCC family thiol-disulfide oxidoreductase YuxK
MKREALHRGQSARPPLDLFYDGECPLCRRVVRFLLQRIPAGAVRILPLGSPEAGRLAALFPVMTPWPDSIVVMDGGTCYVHSAAALRLVGRMRLPWRWLGVLALVPAPLRDAVYRWVARRRHCLLVHSQGTKDTTRLGA